MAVPIGAPPASSCTVGKPVNGQAVVEVFVKVSVAYWCPATPEPRCTSTFSALLRQPTGVAVDFVAVGLVAVAVLVTVDGALEGAVTTVEETGLTGTDA